MESVTWDNNQTLTKAGHSEPLKEFNPLRVSEKMGETVKTQILNILKLFIACICFDIDGFCSYRG